MAVTSVHTTNISCDGLEVTCSEQNNLSYDQPQPVAARMAANLGWSINGEIACPSCRTAHTQ